MGIAEGEHPSEGANDKEQRAHLPAPARTLGRRATIVVGAIAMLGAYQAITALVPRTPRPHPPAPAVAMNDHRPALAPQVAAASSAPHLDAPPASTHAAHAHRHAAPRHHVVSKCTRNGAVSFSDAPCEAGARTELVTVQPDRNLTDGLLPSQVERAATKAAAASPDVAVADADPDALRRQQCEALQARVRAIDEGAGEAATAQAQDALAQLRREYRDAQFRMHC